MSPASALHPSSAFDADQYGDGFSFDENRDPRRPVVSPRLEEMAQPNAFRAREKHISADHSIVYTGAPPRLAYFKPEDLPDAAVYKQILPKREDHPELPTNTPTIKMHRPEALRKMRRVRRERLVAAAARGEPHAIRELAEKNERERVQLMKERRQRALRKAVFMRGLKRLTQSDQNDAKIRNRAKDGSQGVRRNSKRIALLKERKLKARAYVYREWDEYRDDNDGQLAGGVDENGRPIIRNKNTEDDNPRSVRRSINSFDMYVKEHEVIWAPKTAKQVLAEERLFKGIMKKAGPGMKKQFAEYMPKVSTGDMRKVIQIKRAGNRLLEDLLRQREGSTPDVDMAPAGHGWREEEIKAKLEKGVVLDDEED